MSKQIHPYSVLTISDSSASLLFTPCPGLKSVETADALLQLKEAGASALITLMSNSELEQFELHNFEQQVADSGLIWFQLPIEDKQTPDKAFESSWLSFEQAIQALINEGKSIAIHCKGGSGRTGLMAALILAARNQSLNEVIAQIQAIRPRALTLEVHTHYLNQWAAKYSKGEK